MQSGSRKVLQGLFEQKIDGTLCDVQLHVEGSILWGHSCVLALCSPYFKEYFKQRFLEDIYWSTRKPLIITLDNNDVKELCLDCISKIINFVYLRELIVLKGHFQHFCKIVGFLKVLDLLPLCEEKMSVDISNCKLLNEKINENLINHVKVADDNILKKPIKFECNNSKNKLDLPIGNEVNNIPVDASRLQNQNNNNKILESVTKTVDGLELPEPRKKDTSMMMDAQNFKCQEIGENKKLKKSFEMTQSSTYSFEKCEFLCCNPDSEIKTLSDQGKKNRKRRKIHCESCQFTSSSIKTMLKHVQNMNHFVKCCPVCNLKAESIEYLKKHLKDHDHPKPFICNICQKRTRFWEYYKLHLKVHCRKKMFSCEICQKRFQHKTNFAAHLKAHNYNSVSNEFGDLSTNTNNFQSHNIQRNERLHFKNCEIQRQTEQNIKSTNEEQNKFKTIKKFQCHFCSERFTQQKNLKRHVNVKHFSVTEYKCTMCIYVTKRYDLLQDHMKKQHNCLPTKEKQVRKKRESKMIQRQEENTKQNGIVGVLIPVQLVPADGSSAINAFAVKACKNKLLSDKEDVTVVSRNTEEAQNSGVTLNVPDSETTQSSVEVFHKPQVENCTFGKDPQHFSCTESNNFEDHIDLTFTKNIESSELSNNYLCTEKLENIHFDVGKESWSCKSSDLGNNFLEKNEHLWLNEITGELLSGNNFMNLPMINEDYNVDNNNCFDTSKDKSSLEFKDPFQTLLLNKSAGDLSIFDLEDDDRQSNTHTNLIDIDSQDNLFSWENFCDNFCSTWVLNETTGELNLVSFGMQPLKNCDELKLDEISGTLSTIDDDETALFLNEGTGDLSVIYFNPSKSYCDSSNNISNDQLIQDNLETLSQHSNDEDDLLNEEFLLASASFMSRDENETFLNELTGEFDIASYNFDSESRQVIGNESIYLNEETGEISWNVVDKNMNNDLLTNSDSLGFDIDDSLNCDNFEHFSTEINDFSSQFSLDNGNSDDWHNFDETCDTLLNECTGELVKRI